MILEGYICLPGGGFKNSILNIVATNLVNFENFGLAANLGLKVLCFSFLHQFGVVLGNDFPQVWEASITNFNGIPVDERVYGVFFREVLIY